MAARPRPPKHLCSPLGAERFEPSLEMAAFLSEVFLREGAPFWREEYEHLKGAKIAVLWTNVERVKDGMRTLGMAQLFRLSGDRWASGRTAQQVLDWFGDWWADDLDDPFPDFLLTFYAPAAAGMDDATFCALCSHELRHCGHKRDRWGEPMYDENGDPVFAMQGHDVEEFVSVVEDFGIEAAGPAAVRLVEAARRAPRFRAGEVEGVCGCGAVLRAVA